jgi:hypothetical protein
MSTHDLSKSAAHIAVGLINEYIQPMFQVFRARPIDPKALMEQMPEGERIEAQHYLRLAEYLSRPVTSKSMDGLIVCQHLANIGLNPIEFILTSLRAANSTEGRTARFIPTLQIRQFNGYGQDTESVMEKHFRVFGVPHPDLLSTTEEVKRHIDYHKVYAQDAALQAFLDCQAYPHQYAVGLPLSDPKARLFAVVFGSVKNLGYLAVSPLLRECREVWFSELKAASDVYQKAASKQLLLSLSSLERHELYDELSAQLRPWVMEMAQGFTDPDIDIQTDGLPVHHVGKDPIGQLGFALDEWVELASLMAQTGNFKLTLCGLKSLFKYPAGFVEVLLTTETPETEVHRLFSCCLASHLLDMSSSECVQLGMIQSLLDEYRQAFMTQGFSDIKGTKAMDGLVVHLDMAEGFERLGYLRREEMELGAFFALRHNQESDQDTAQLHSNPAPIRKMSLAMKLNQHKTIEKAVEAFFIMQPGENSDLTLPASALHFLESSTQPIELLLNTRKKIQRALAAGIKSSVILECKKLKRFHEDVLGRDLGL